MRRHRVSPFPVRALTGAFLVAAIVATLNVGSEASGSCNANFNLVYNPSGVANDFNVCLSTEGNVVNFVFTDNPAGTPVDHHGGLDGYQLCSPVGDYWDMGSRGSIGFSAATFTQANGPGTLPIVITRTTDDGRWELKQQYAKDNTEGDFTITMTLKNLGIAVASPVYLGRWTDLRMNNSPDADNGDNTRDSLVAVSAVGDRNGETLQAVTRATTHFAGIGVFPFGILNSCAQTGDGPLTNADLSGHVVYNLGGFTAGQSKSVKFAYARK
jgi:hypothetical protein